MDTGSVSKQRFVAQVNRLCRGAWPMILKDFEDYSDQQSPRLSRRQLYARSVRRAFLNDLDLYVFDDIRELKAPRDEKAAVEEMIGKMQAAVERGWWHVPSYSRIQLWRQFASYNEAARLYGLWDCLVDGEHLPGFAG